MALPVAQLGYLPNMNTPTARNDYLVEDPWQKLAMQALGAVVTSGVGNVLEKDFTQIAQNEGLPIDAGAEAAPWYKKIFTGATTDQEQLGQLRQQQGTMNVAAMTQNREDARAKEGRTFTAGENERDRTFRASEGQAGRQHATDMLGRELDFRALEGEAERGNRMNIAQLGAETDLEQANRNIAGAFGREQLQRQTALDVAGMRTTDNDKVLEAINNASTKFFIMSGRMPTPQEQQAITDQIIASAERLGYKMGQPVRAPNVPLVGP